jgi:hypothetical protein
VVKGHLPPVYGIVALATFRPEAAVVGVILAVAGVTGGRDTSEEITGMAANAVGWWMSAGQTEAGPSMIEVNLPPVRGIMAGGAACFWSLVLIVLAVAGVAVVRSIIEPAVKMAIGAGDIDVSSGQGVTRLGVVKAHLSPIAGIVTLAAVGCRSLVFVILAVAGITVRGDFDEAIGLMTINAGRVVMFPGEPEVG